jgi:hypothetical protein
MQYMPGTRLGDCLDNLTDAQSLRTAMDMADIMFSLFQITASRCGSVLPIQHSSRDDSTLGYVSPRHPFTIPNTNRIDDPLEVVTVVDTHYFVGPVNDITFLNYPQQVPASSCGPFISERQWVEAFAFLGNPPTRLGEKPSLWAFEKVLEVYDFVTQRYWSSSPFTSSKGKEVFHLAHGDLSCYNILVDTDTGAITGLVDWEMAGFRPAWLAAAAGSWLNDDAERFLMKDHQSRHGDYEGEGPGDALNRARFRLRLAHLDDNLFRHTFQGVELRALFYACCYECAGNAEIWLEHYIETEWSEKRRGPFLFDFMAELWDKLTLEERFAKQASCGAASIC